MAPSEERQCKYFEVLYCKRSNKKRKTFMDGVLELSGKRATLMDMEGKRVTSTFCTVDDMKNGETLDVGAYELEVTKVLSSTDFESGKIFMAGAVAQPADTGGVLSLGAAPRMGVRAGPGRKRGAAGALAAPGKRGRPAPPSAGPVKPRYDPTAPGALVLDGGASGSCPIVVDPLLASKLREHQREGVRFLWRCITGNAAEGADAEERDAHVAPEGLQCRGCILADEMGLGKTLTTIAAIWTALKQGPRGAPLARRAVVVTPSSLVDNWAREFKKWLGNERLRPLVMNVKGQDAAGRINDFEHGSPSVYPVLIISYEMYRKFAARIHAARPGLMVCDEAHRLKSSTGNKTIAALGECPTRRRVLLTGTPVQNDLEEFFAMLSFANPSILGTRQSFRNVFAGPIEKGRDKRASPAEQALADSRSQQLQALTSAFILRRTSDLLRKHLPPKTETVVFCRLTEAQQRLYEGLIASGTFRSAVQATGRGGRTVAEEPLQLIGVLRLLCTHPFLAMAGKDGSPSPPAAAVAGGAAEEALAEARQQSSAGMVAALLEGEGYGAEARAGRASALSADMAAISALSGKCRLLAELLRGIARVGDRVVVVSAFTCTLDLIARMCEHIGLGCMRLDGSTDASKRQTLVNRFNMPGCPEAVFLLSAKAGGVGLNLIGANRLVMVDLDWNPAVDQQAMARVWRDGQRKQVYVYRLFVTGSIEEKMYQRQFLKLDMAGSIVQKGKAASKAKGKESSGPGRLSRDELRKLFSLRTDTDCDTYDVLAGKEGTTAGGQYASWVPYAGPASIEDEVLRSAVEATSMASFVHSEHTSPLDEVAADAPPVAGGTAAMEEEGDEDEAEVDDGPEESSDANAASGPAAEAAGAAGAAAPSGSEESSP